MLAEEKRKALHCINNSTKALMRIDALAGAGKAMIISAILHAVVPQLNKGEVLGIIVPGRSLRDDSVQTVMATLALLEHGQLGGLPPGKRVLWLGRPSDAARPVGLWEEHIAQFVEEQLVEPRKILAKTEGEIGQVIKSMEKMQDTEPEIEGDIGALWMACIIRRCSRQTPATETRKFSFGALASYMQLFLHA